MATNSMKNLFNLVDSVKKLLPPEQTFLTDLERSIELTAGKNKHVGSKSYKPSGMKCMRQSYYVITGAESDPFNEKFDLIGMGESGSDRHKRLQQAVLDMKNNNMQCEYINVADYVRQRKLDEYLDIVQEPDFEHEEYETKLYHKTLNISFLCDGIIDYKNHYYILEIKTEASFKFMNRTGVDPAHFKQAIAYSTMLGINQVLFVYECRDNCAKKAYIFEVTDEMKQDFVGYIDECDGYIAQQKVPPKTTEGRTCNYCGFKKQCMKDG